MKTIGMISTAALSLILGVAAPIWAQQDQHEQHDQQQEQKNKPAQQDAKHGQQEEKKAQPNDHQSQQEKQQQAQQEQKQEQNNQQHAAEQQKENQNNQKQQQNQRVAKQQENQDKQTQQAQQKEHQAKPDAQHAQQHSNPRPKYTPEQVRVQHTAWQQHGSQNWESDHRTWQQRGGYIGYRIPDTRFRGYFGPSHGFRIYGLPFLVVGGYPRFQYQGYWLSPVDPWPAYWGDNWYDNDDVYVNYVDNGYYLYNRRYPTQGIAINITL